MTKRRVRVGCASGFWGDSDEGESEDETGEVAGRGARTGPIACSDDEDGEDQCVGSRTRAGRARRQVPSTPG